MPDDKPMCSPLPGEDITDIDGPDQDVDQVPLIDTVPGDDTREV